MSDDMISQEEIDALLNGGGVPAAEGSDAPAGDAAGSAAGGSDSSSSQFDDVLSDMEKDALEAYSNSPIHDKWINEYPQFLESKVIMDYED